MSDIVSSSHHLVSVEFLHAIVMNVKKVRNRSTLLLDANIVAGDIVPVNSKSLDFDTATEEEKQRGWSLVNSVYKKAVEESLRFVAMTTTKCGCLICIDVDL